MNNSPVLTQRVINRLDESIQREYARMMMAELQRAKEEEEKKHEKIRK